MTEQQSQPLEVTAKNTPKSEQAIIRLTERCTVFGTTGTGKTTYAKWFIKNVYIGNVKVLIWDPLHQYGEFGEVVKDYKALLKCNISDKKKAIIFQPTALQDNEDFFDAVAKFANKKGNIVLIAEEIDEYMTPQSMTPEFRALIRRGRNEGIGHYGIGHRFNGLNGNYLELIDHCFIFRLKGNKDIQRVDDYLSGVESDGITGETIKNLPDRHFVHVYTDRLTGKSIAKMCKPIAVPKSKESEKAKSQVPSEW